VNSRTPQINFYTSQAIFHTSQAIFRTPQTILTTAQAISTIAQAISTRPHSNFHRQYLKSTHAQAISRVLTLVFTPATS
jgi:hypothetical protein